MRYTGGVLAIVMGVLASTADASPLVAALPEPASLVLFGIGLMATAITLRRGKP